MITITYDDGVNPVRSFSISDAVQDSLEQLRQSFGSTFPTIADMFKYYLNGSCIAPALKQFPTTEVQTALTGITTAQETYATVLQAAIEGALG